MGAAQDTDPTIELLIDVRDIIAETDITMTTVITTEELLKKLIALEASPWATWRRDKPITAHGLARLLGPLDVHPHRHLRTNRGYRVDAFTEVFARYLPMQASQRHDANNNGGKPRDTCDSKQASENPKRHGVSPIDTGSVTLRHFDHGDASDEHF